MRALLHNLRQGGFEAQNSCEVHKGWEEEQSASPLLQLRLKETDCSPVLVV